MNKKSGITLASLVIYIVLFTAFTAFTTTLSSNMNENLLSSRGQAINLTNINKIEYNLNASSLESKDVILAGNVITFSNGDVYRYDDTHKAILKNNGVICDNVEVTNISLVGVKDGSQNVFCKRITLEVTLNKYLNEVQRVIICSVEVV